MIGVFVYREEDESESANFSELRKVYTGPSTGGRMESGEILLFKLRRNCSM